MLPGEILVSLDLETTGLNRETDRIIEIGAVKFRGSQVIETFHTLVNPRRPLPYRTQRLTGITSSDVRTAPSFPEIADTLISFVGAHPLVGQNISFDLDFLSTHGVSLANPVYDTQELARLVLPWLVDTSLPALAKALGVPCEVRHRALPDALTAKEVFLALVEEASRLPPLLIQEINRLTAATDWMFRPLFQELERGMPLLPGAGEMLRLEQIGRCREKPEAGQPLTPCPHPQPLDLTELASLFQEGGAIARSFPAYEHRPGQVAMMLSVAEALNQSQHLLVEAGTGIGKSLAYLLPAILFSLRNETPVLISTNTINLQEQLMHKDIPDLLQAVDTRLGSRDFRAAQLKGRGNYLCLKRWNLWRHSPKSAEELNFLLRTLVWLFTAASGDRAELSLQGNEFVCWSQICAPEECPRGKCAYEEQGSCFLYRARRQAERAHVVVINHALLLADMVKGGKILPPAGQLIIDEAHHLEEEATKQLGFQISRQDIAGYLSRLYREAGTPFPGGFLPHLVYSLRGSPLAACQRRELEELTEKLGQQVQTAQARAAQLFHTLLHFLYSHIRGGGDYERHLRLTRAIRREPEWAKVMNTWEELNRLWEKLETGLEHLNAALEDLTGAGDADFDELLVELAFLRQQAQELRSRGGEVLVSPRAEMIYWLSLTEPEEIIHLCAAPLQVGRALEQGLFSRKDCVILTSATLTTEGNFEYIKERLGLKKPGELLIPSPFDYLSSTLVYLPQDVPPPDAAGYQQAVERALFELCRAAEGRTLALFTSHTALRLAHNALQGVLEREDILVLGQGVDGNPRQILAAFRNNPRAIILGTSSFWEGVDISGDALRVVVITRLPFAVPTHPVISARSELFPDPFNQYSLPQAILRFKQGFGRLIRSRQDRGVVVVLDQRLQSKPYGKAFLQSLPPCTIKAGFLREMGETVRGWLKYKLKGG